MVKNTQTIEWKATFFKWQEHDMEYDEDFDDYADEPNERPIHFYKDAVKSATFINKQVAFHLSASIVQAQDDEFSYLITFYLHLDRCENNSMIKADLSFRPIVKDSNNFEFTILKDQVISVKKAFRINKVNAEFDLERFSLPENSSAVSASIELKITFQEEKKENNYINAWNSSMNADPLNHSTALCQQLAAFGDDSRFTDMTICTVADGREFSVHSVILSLRSPVFAAMFSASSCRENQLKKVEVEDIDGNVMEAFLAYLYGRIVPNWETIAGELAYAANKYDIQPLYNVCVFSLSAYINVEIAAKNFFYANQMGLEDCMKEISKFISQHKCEVVATEGWIHFIQQNPVLLEKLYLYEN